MRYVNEEKFYDIVNKEVENLKCNSDIGLYESCELDSNGKLNLDTLDYEYYENFIYDKALEKVSEKYKIKYKGYNVSKAFNPLYHRIY
jgi:hypothetical protein